jgi:light-regulated signal transduction histidine kinase (bacteriophytochrome)
VGEINDPQSGDPLLVTTSPILDDAGRLVGIVHVGRNIKNTKNTELELQSTVAKLKNANRELNTLAYAAAHDLRTPLRGVAITADWLQRDYGTTLDAQGQELVTLLIERMHRMDRLIDGMLAYCRIGELRKEWVKIEEIIDECLTDIDCPANWSILREGIWPAVFVDKRLFTDVIRNILDNAIQFMDKPDGRIILRGEELEDRWQFSIADNGPGIDTQYAWKVFYIFYTLAPKDKNKGVGMGLALAKRIVEAHEGRIWVETHPGGGSTFFFTLPKSNNTPAHAAVEQEDLPQHLESAP